MFEFANNLHNAPKHISDEEILGWILDGSLVMTEVETPHPKLTFRGRSIQAYLNRQGGRVRVASGSERYRFKLRNGSKVVDGKRIPIQRNIVRPKLVWMFVNRCVVPPDCLIDHGDGGKLDDSIGNIEALTHAEHSEKHYGPAADDDF